MVHATVGTDKGHKGPFKKLATRLGLIGKMTATVASPELKTRLDAMAAELGPYPHAAMNTNAIKKQTTRMVKVECAGCGYIVRTTEKWIEVGLPTCPCGEEMKVV